MQADQMSQSNKALNCLKKADITQFKSFLNPPQQLKSLMQWIGLFFDKDLSKWQNAKKFMLNMQFLQQLRKLDRSMSQQKIQRIKAGAKKFQFDKEDSCIKMMKTSKAGECFLRWGLQSLRQAQQLLIK